MASIESIRPEAIAPRLMRLKHAARYLAISPKQLRTICQNGRIPVIKGLEENSPWLLDRQDLDLWIERSKESL